MFSGNDQIPGSNILTMALRVIARQGIVYYEAIDRSLNSVGQNVTVYAPPVTIYGSFQPVQKSLYQTLGLDFQKVYFNLYVPNSVIDVQRDVSGDQITYQGQRYQCESSTPWYGIDGWTAVLCVQIALTVNLFEIFGFNQNLTFPALLNTNQNFFNSNFYNTGGE